MTKTNKIINGVDVSECDYAILPKKQCSMKSMPYAKETSCIACKEHNTKHNFCKNNPNCNFKRLKRKEQECEALKGENFTLADLIKTQEEQLDDDNVIIERFLIASGKSKDITEPDEFEEVFQDIEQTYSEHEELNKECKDLKQALDEIEKIVSADYYDDSWGTLAIKIDSIKEIINKAKED